MKTTQIALEADKLYNNFKVTKEAIVKAFNPGKTFPITMQFQSNNIVGWGTMVSCDDGKLEVEMKLSPAGEALIRECWELRSGGKVPLRGKVDEHITIYTEIDLDMFALCPPDIPRCPRCSMSYGTPTGLCIDTQPPMNMMECKNCGHQWGEIDKAGVANEVDAQA